MAALTVVLVSALCRPAEGSQPPRFAVYRAAVADTGFVVNAFGEGSARWSREHVDRHWVTRNAKAAGEPLLTDADVIEYCWSRQWFRLTEEAATRWNASLKGHRTLAGEAFVVVVDDAYCYGGMIWSMASSQSPPRVPILLNMALNGVLMTNVSGGMLNTQDDTRYDDRIRRVFEELGKLELECAEDWWK